RHPIQRFISFYTWVALHRDLPDVFWVPEVIRQGASLEEYADFVLETGQIPGGFMPCEYFTNVWRTFGCIPAKFRKPVAEARFIIENHFAVLGLTEMFDETLYVFAKLLQLEQLPRWQLRGNSGAVKQDQLSEDLRAKIASITAADCQLYDWNKEVFLESFAHHIAEFRSLNIQLRHEGDEGEIRTLTNE
ncbi:MAG: hypothetical protein ACAI44_39420, partial [Candidatus Sericytochromatia bacterium]